MADDECSAVSAFCFEVGRIQQQPHVSAVRGAKNPRWRCDEDVLWVSFIQSDGIDIYGGQSIGEWHPMGSAVGRLPKAAIDRACIDDVCRGWIKSNGCDPPDFDGISAAVHDHRGTDWTPPPKDPESLRLEMMGSGVVVHRRHRDNEVR